MRSNKDFRSASGRFGPEDSAKKAIRLEPIKKSGKERYTVFGHAEEDYDEDAELMSYKKQESALDYYDDGEEDL